MDFDNWLLRGTEMLIEFADHVVGAREVLRMSGNGDTPFYESMNLLWEQVSAELERRGLLADFKYDRSMD